MSKQALPVRPSKRKQGKDPSTEFGGRGAREKRPSTVQTATSILPEAVLLVAAAYLFLLARGFEQAPEPGQLGPSFWPQVLCVGIAGCSFARLVQKVLAGRRTSVASTAAASNDEDEYEVAWARIGLATALVIGYVLGIVFVGYILATTLFFVAFAYLGGQRQWYVAPLGALSSLALAYVFLKVVYVSLPSGIGVFDQFSVLVYRLLGIY